MLVSFGTTVFEYKDLGFGLLNNVLDVDPECKEIEISPEHLTAYSQAASGQWIKYDGTTESIKLIEQTYDSLNYLLYDVEKTNKWFKQVIIESLKTIIINKRSVEKFFERYIDKINWSWLSSNTNLSEEFFDRHIDKVNWEMLSCNPNISEEFF